MSTYQSIVRTFWIVNFHANAKKKKKKGGGDDGLGVKKNLFPYIQIFCVLQNVFLAAKITYSLLLFHNARF